MTTCARSARRLSVSATRCAVTPPMPASISSKTSVSPPATTASASATRESSPPDAVSATGPNGMPGFGRIRKTASSRPLGPGSRSFSSTLELALPHARRPRGSRRPRRRTARPPRPSAACSAAITASNSLLGAGELGRGGRERVEATVERVEIGGGAVAALEQLLQRLAAKRRRSSAIRSSRASTSSWRAGIGLERGDEPVQVAADLAQAHGQLAELARPGLRARARAGSAARARARLRPRAMPLRLRPRARRPPSPARRPRRGRLRGACGRARRAATPPRPPAARRCARRGRAAPRCALRRRRRRARSPRGAVARRSSARQAARACAPPLELLRADERVQHVELVGGPREPTLLELARHRDQPLRRGGEILARDRAPPRVRPRAAVSEHAARQDEPRLVLRPQLRERLRAALVEEPVGHVELRLDVRLARGRARPRRHRP